MRGRRVVFPEKGRVEVQDFDVPAVGPHSVLVRTEVSLISAGTELTTLLGQRGTERYPSQPGYSNVGLVEEVGREVAQPKPGDRVLTLGHHASHLVVDLSPEQGDSHPYLQPVPGGVRPADAVFAILGSVAIHGVRKAEPQLKQAAAVIGQGVVGQLIAQIVRVAGCSPVIGADVFPMRLEKARQSGTHYVVNSAEEDLDAVVRDVTGGRGVELAFDATRNAQTIHTLMKIAAQSGRVIIVGSIPGTVEISLYDPLQMKELTIIGAHQPKSPLVGHPYNPWTQSRNRMAFLELVRDGLVRVDHLLTHLIPGAEAPRAYEMIRAGGSDWLGVAFSWE